MPWLGSDREKLLGPPAPHEICKPHNFLYVGWRVIYQAATDLDSGGYCVLWVSSDNAKICASPKVPFEQREEMIFSGTPTYCDDRGDAWQLSS